jgi:hypothetical protein
MKERVKKKGRNKVKIMGGSERYVRISLTGKEHLFARRFPDQCPLAPPML